MLQFINFAPNLPIFSFSDGLMERSERSARPRANSSPYDFYGKPFYGKTTTDVIVQEGSHAFFHCLVHNLGNKTVRKLQQHNGHDGENNSLYIFVAFWYRKLQIIFCQIDSLIQLNFETNKLIYFICWEHVLSTKPNSDHHLLLSTGKSNKWVQKVRMNLQ